MQGTESVVVLDGKTVIDINGCHENESRGSHCGYCQGQKPNAGHCQWGITSCKMTVADYQKLMDRGWRRCGTYYYKFDFEKSCCQPYTIKLDSSEYQISHSQKKVMKRFNKFLLGEIGMDGKKIDAHEESKQGEMAIDQSPALVRKTSLESGQRDVIRIALQMICKHVLNSILTTDEQLEDIAKGSIISLPRDKQLKDTLSWSTNILIKLFFKLKDLKQLDETQLKDGVRGVVERIRAQSVMLIELAGIAGCELVKVEDNGYLTFVTSQKGEPTLKKPEKSKMPKEEDKKENEQQQYSDDLMYTQYFKEHVPLKPEQKLKKLQHRYTVSITKAIANAESFQVYKYYQEKVHHEPEKSIGGYSGFLCKSPLFDASDPMESIRDPFNKRDIDQNRVTKDEGVWPEYLGSYHMIHRIDGEIFAVGVLDFTPQVLSSVYLYYNPKYEFLSPGTFAAVREIEYCLRIQEVFNPDFKFYYMGLYFQDCIKSIYKGTYKPSQVLCPHTCNYVYLTDEVREKISKALMPRLSELPLIKELDLKDSQIDILMANFRIYYSQRKTMLKFNEISSQYQRVLQRILKALYKTLGLDIMMTTTFYL